LAVDLADGLAACAGRYTHTESTQVHVYRKLVWTGSCRI